MTRPWRTVLRVMLAVGAVCGAVGCGASGVEPNGPEAVRVSIGPRTWTAEVAADHQSRWKGLSGRESLADDEAMLFVFPEPAVKTFCMRGCRFDIDIAFLNADREIVTIHQMKREPDALGEVGYSSQVPAKYALEVRGGELEEAGASVGDRVEIQGRLPQAR